MMSGLCFGVLVFSSAGFFAARIGGSADVLIRFCTRSGSRARPSWLANHHHISFELWVTVANRAMGPNGGHPAMGFALPPRDSD